MSFFSEIATFWTNNATLEDALPYASSVWIDSAPPGSEESTPYAVLTAVSNVPTWTNEAAIVSNFTFDINIYSTSAATAESLGATVAGVFALTPVSGNTMACYIVNGPILRKDDSTPITFYRCFISFRLEENRTLPAT